MTCFVKTKIYGLVLPPPIPENSKRVRISFVLKAHWVTHQDTSTSPQVRISFCSRVRYSKLIGLLIRILVQGKEVRAYGR